MKTKLTQSPSIAARFIQHGEVVAFPTETVYGLAANIFNEEAIKKVFEAKGRPPDNPLIAHIADISQLESMTSSIPPTARQFINRLFPGPLTLVLPKGEKISKLATAGLDTIGVRMPRHKIAQQFLRACGVPVVAPSANLSGRPSPTTWQAVKADLDGRIGCILKGDRSPVGLESTVVDCTGDAPIVLRAGAVSLEQLRAVIPETRLSDQSSPDAPKSPGQKHKHYSPTAKVSIILYPKNNIASEDSAYIGIDPPPQPDAYRKVLICKDLEQYAQSLFQFFRDCDDDGIKTIFCQSTPEEGLGLALMDRITRAAEE